MSIATGPPDHPTFSSEPLREFCGNVICTEQEVCLKNAVFGQATPAGRVRDDIFNIDWRKEFRPVASQKSFLFMVAHLLCLFIDSTVVAADRLTSSAPPQQNVWIVTLHASTEYSPSYGGALNKSWTFIANV